MFKGWSFSRSARKAEFDCHTRGNALVFRCPEGLSGPEDVGRFAATCSDPKTARRLRVLAQWLEEDRAVWLENELEVPLAGFYLAEEEDRRALGLAEPCPFGLDLRSVGQLSSPEVQLLLEWRPTPGEPRNGWRREACFLTHGERRFLLTAEAFALVMSIEDFVERTQEERHYEAHLKAFTRIKAQAVAAGARLDPYLSQETAHLPERVGVEVREAPDGTLEIRPDFEGFEVEAIDEALGTFKDVPTVFTLRDGRDRGRVILSTRLQDATRQVQRVRRLHGSDADRFLVAPETFLDPDLVDLSDFGARVVGIGRVPSRAHPLITYRPNEWIPSEVSLVVSSVDGRSEDVVLPLQSLEELAVLEYRYEQARQAGTPCFRHGDHLLSADEGMGATLEQVKEALTAITTGASILPETSDATPPDRGEAPSGPMVLLTRGNVEELQYAEDLDRSFAPAEIREDLLEPVPGMQPGFRLLPHQCIGVAWMQQAFLNRQRGILLADDMGLGKTLQILSFWRWAQSKAPDLGPMLVIAPVALLENWVEEAQRFCEPWEGGYSVLNGQELDRMRLPGMTGTELGEGQPIRKLDRERLRSRGLVLVSYETVRNYQFSIASVDWGLVVLDEAQKAKNPDAMVTRAIKALKARFRIVATGTPVENDLPDLWCLSDIAQPGVLGSLSEFRKQYGPAEGTVGPRDLGHLRKRLAPVLIRRMKADILKDLPPRYDHTDHVPMSESQVKSYLELIASRGAEQGRGSALELLRKLRLLSCHPALLELDGEARIQLKDLPQESPKLWRVLELVERCRQSEEKVILFARERQLQRVLQALLSERFGIEVPVVNGETPGVSTSGRSRKAILDRFQSRPGFCAAVLSPEAVGYGLTLVAATQVIHVTRLWNPAKEDQATDRVHRIGQVRPVHVHVPIATDPGGRFAAFDQVLDQLLMAKRSLARQVLFPAAGLDIEAALLGGVLKARETLG